MPQSVIIQTESALPANSKHASSDKVRTDGEAFSAQFDQQIKQAEASISRPQTDNGLAATTAEEDKEIAADGNNLPTEKASKQEASESVANESSTTDDSEAEHNSKPVTAEKSGVEQASVPVAAAETIAQSSQSEADTDSDVADKPIRAQVSVSQQAVDNAKAAPVEMTAKVHPKQVTEAQSQTGTASKAVSTSDKTPTTNVKPDLVQTAVSTKAATETVTSDKPVTPNLAAVLKQSSQEDSKAPKIRADILEALQGRQAKQEVDVNLRNQLVSQMTVKVDATAVTSPTALANAGLADSVASPLMTFSAGGVLNPTGQASIQANVLSPAVISLPVQPGMQSPAWGQVMSSRVVWAAKEGLQQAQLRMNPANMGPVEVKLLVQNDQASVTFLAQHSATRDALEQALPRLRESFAESGMELANAEVGEQQQHHQEQSEQASESGFFTQAVSQDDDIEAETVETVSSEQTTGLSLYA
jgi:flagellar hook-length control protein FliK